MIYISNVNMTICNAYIMITKITNICNLLKYFYCVYDCKHPFLGYICIQYNFTLFILLPTCLFFL